MKNISFDKTIIIVISILLACLFIFLFFLKYWADRSDENLPINAYFENDLSTTETLEFKINDSTYFVTLDSNEDTVFQVSYRLGLNNISIAFFDTGQFTDDTLTIDKREPGIINVEIDKPTDKLGLVWSVDSTSIHKFYFLKSLIKVYGDKRIKFAIQGQYIEWQ
jgi:hypothetical protein